MNAYSTFNYWYSVPCVIASLDSNPMSNSLFFEYANFTIFQHLYRPDSMAMFKHTMYL